MTNTEKRRAPRYPIDIEATIITPAASIPARALDISVGGIRVLSPDPVLPETDIVLSLAAREEILLSGSVLWSIAVGQTPVEFEMGIEADALIFGDQEAIGHAEREALVAQILSRTRQDLHQGICRNSSRINSSR